MITLEEAREAVNRRLGVLVGGKRDVRDCALVCSGTDVHGPDLAREIHEGRLQFALMADFNDPDNVGSAVNGIMHRIFWLGFEYGKAED